MSLFLPLFFASGFCSLLYEVVWLRLAMGVFGVTAPFISIFLSVFMVGLGLGSWGAGRLCRRLEGRPAAFDLRLYAAAEALIALSSLAVPFLLESSRAALAGAFGGVAWGSASYYWATGAVTAAVLLPWCLCMGATFPLAMSAIAKRSGEGARHSFSSLYLANVVGAGTGTLAAPFALIELLGFRGALHAGAAVNLAIAAAALAASFAPSMTAATRHAAAAAAARDGARPDALPLLFLTGLAGMAMQVVWTRLFTPFLGNSVYAFASILAVYLLACAAGSWLYRATLGRGALLSDGLWLAAGALSLLPLYAADPFLPLNPYVRIVLGLAPFCGLLGFLTPSLIDAWSEGDPQRAGAAYAVNIAGCIAGPLIAGFLLLPHMGENAALGLLSAPLFAAGLLAVRRLRGGAFRMGRAGPAALFAGASALAALMAALAGTFDDVVAMYHANLEVRRDYQASVTAGGTGLDRVLQINNIGMTVMTPITKVMAHLPLAFLPRPPRSALVICFGMGTTFRSLLSWGIPATAVELVPSVPGLFGFFHEDAAALLASPNARVVIDDGRRFLARGAETYDVITLDPAPPMTAAGTSFLFSEEFYAEAKARLAPDGIMQIWIVEPLEPLVLGAFAAAIKNSFPHVRVFRSFEGVGYHVLASREPLAPYAAADLLARVPPAAVRDLLELGPKKTGLAQFRALLDGEVPVDSLLVPGTSGLRDDRPVNEYYFLRGLRP